MLKARRRLILIGAGGFAHEVLWLAREIPEADRDWEVGGFLDDNPDAAAVSLLRKQVSLPVLGTTLDYAPREEDCFALAIGAPAAKLNIAARLASRGAQFVTLAHPTSSVMQHAVIGHGCLFLRRTTVGPYVTLGSFVTMNNDACFGHDSVAEDGVTLSPGCQVAGTAILRTGAFMGSNAVVLGRVEVGDFAVVGAGSVAVRKVKPGTTVMGVPAKEFC